VPGGEPVELVWGLGIRGRRVCVSTHGYGRHSSEHYRPEVEMAEQSQDPKDTDPDPGEAGFGPGEQGDSIEEGRQGEQAGDEQDSGDGEG